MTCASPQNRDAEPIKRSPNLKAVYLEEFKRSLAWAHSADYRHRVLAVAAKKAIQEIEENRLNLAL
jgi:hypothetical protein